MAKLPITIASWDYEDPRKDGTVEVEGCDVTYLTLRADPGSCTWNRR